MENSRERSSPFSLEFPTLQQSTSRLVPAQPPRVSGVPPPPSSSSSHPLQLSFIPQQVSRSSASPFIHHHGDSKSGKNLDAPATSGQVSGGLRPSPDLPPPPNSPSLPPLPLPNTTLSRSKPPAPSNPRKKNFYLLPRPVRARQTTSRSTMDPGHIRPSSDLPPPPNSSPLPPPQLPSPGPPPLTPPPPTNTKSTSYLEPVPDPVAAVPTLGARCRRPVADPTTPPPPTSSCSFSLPTSSSSLPLIPPPTPSFSPVTQPPSISPGANPVLDGPDSNVRRRRPSLASDEPPPPSSSSSSLPHLPCSPPPQNPPLTSPKLSLPTGLSTSPKGQQPKDGPWLPPLSSPREKDPHFEIGQTSHPPSLSRHPKPFRPRRIPPAHDGKGILGSSPSPFLSQPSIFPVWPLPPPPGFAYFLCLLPVGPPLGQPPVSRRRRRRGNRRGKSSCGTLVPHSSPPVVPPASSGLVPPSSSPPLASEPPGSQPSSVVLPSAAVLPNTAVGSPEQRPLATAPSSETTLSPSEFPHLPAVSTTAPSSPVQPSQTRPPLTVVHLSVPARSPSSAPRSTASPPSRPRSFSEAISDRNVADLKANASSRLGRAPTRYTPPRTRSRLRLR